MPAKKRPAPQEAVTARQILLDGLARDTELPELLSELAPLHPRNNTFPGEVFLRLAADALDWCGASRADPVALEGMRERLLPDCAFRGRDRHKLQFAVLAAAALRGGAEPDLLDEVAWWQTDDFWQYALFAAVAYIRAAASRAGVPVPQVCRGTCPAPRPTRITPGHVAAASEAQQKDLICPVVISAELGCAIAQIGGSRSRLGRGP